MYPLRFAPLYYEKVWGGRRLETVLGRAIPPGPIGESWEVSDHAHGRSIVMNGQFHGLSLHQLIGQYPHELLGRRVVENYGEIFPLLVKFIDADDKLSVQVHPNDEQAARLEGPGEMGKSEMWYILHADPGAQLIVGLKEGVTREQFREALESGMPAGLLHYLPVKTGDSVMIPAGRVHAIMPGLLILEIQQSSDTTYRLFDWNRVGLDGKPRPLHVEQALEVTNWQDYAPQPGPEQVGTEGANRRSVLASCEFFVVEKYDLAEARAFAMDGQSFRILNCVAGSGHLIWDGGREALAFGDSLLLPAAMGDFSLQPEGAASFVVSYVP